MSDTGSTVQNCWIAIKTSEKNGIITMYILMTLVGGFGNIVSLICVYKQMKIEFTAKQSHKILMSLVISDILASLCLCPSLAASLMFTFSTDFLWSLSSVYMLLSASSSLLLVLLSLERFLKMTKFHRYERLLTDRRVNLAISMCWLVPGVLAILGLVSPLLQGSFYALVVIGTLVALSVFYALIYRYTKRTQVDVITNAARTRNNAVHYENRLMRLTRKVLLFCLLYTSPSPRDS